MPALHLEIDIVTVSATLAGAARRAFRGQWVVFYALLALRADAPGEGRLLGVDELVAFGRWQHKRAASAGKEVARHLAALDAAGLSGLVAHAGRTRRWGLAPGVAVAMIPSAGDVARWVDAQRAVAPIPTLGDLSRLVEATVALHRGEAERAHDLAWEARAEGAHDAAWRAVIAGRAAQRADEGDRLDALERDLAGHGGAAVNAARAKRASRGTRKPPREAERRCPAAPPRARTDGVLEG